MSTSTTWSGWTNTTTTIDWITPEKGRWVVVRTGGGDAIEAKWIPDQAPEPEPTHNEHGEIAP